VYFDDEPDGDRAPICPYCGVTALPVHLANVLDSAFACDNDDCEAFGQELAS